MMIQMGHLNDLKHLSKFAITLSSLALVWKIHFLVRASFESDIKNITIVHSISEASRLTFSSETHSFREQTSSEVKHTSLTRPTIIQRPL